MNNEIIRVRANTNQMKRMYTKLNKVYSLIENFEKSLRRRAMKLLALQHGEIVLEIGFGRGTALINMAKRVGKEGLVYGIDLTPQMVKKTYEKIRNLGLRERIRISQGDARNLPYEDCFFDAVYIASTLELFDTPIIPVVLNEIKRVLKPSGRLCVVSIPKQGREKSLGVRLYEWSHKILPKFSSCRPIYVEYSIKKAGFTITKVDVIGLFLPMKIVIARP